MDKLMPLFAAVVLFATALAGIAAWAPRALWLKITALVLAALLMASGYAGLVELLGRPKPTAMEWSRGSEEAATVLAWRVREGEAIYLWLLVDGRPEPRAYVRPWDMATARQLQEATARGVAEGTAVRMRRPFDAGLDPSELLFHAEPQPALLPKSGAGLSARAGEVRRF